MQCEHFGTTPNWSSCSTSNENSAPKICIIRLPLAGPITKSELMALASVSPTVAGSKPKKLLDQTRDALSRRAPGRQKILKVVKRSALRKARSVPSFDAQRNSIHVRNHALAGIY